MTRPAVEVADILRAQGDRFLDRYRSSFDFQQHKAFRAIQRCRTAALGGHVDACPQCGYQEISYNSCRNRSCPKCQTQARERWLAARERELMPIPYFHVVFTVPHELNVLALDNPRLFYDLLSISSFESWAKLERSKTLKAGKDKKECYVLTIQKPGGAQKQKLWVDKKEFIIWKSVDTTLAARDYGPTFVTTITVTTEQMALNPSLDDSNFVFTPPDQAKKVDSLILSGDNHF